MKKSLYKLPADDELKPGKVYRFTADFGDRSCMLTTFRTEAVGKELRFTQHEVIRPGDRIEVLKRLGDGHYCVRKLNVGDGESELLWCGMIGARFERC